MQNISVIYLSKSIMVPKMGTIIHSHDYWHFTISYTGRYEAPDGSIVSTPYCTCTPPGILHAGGNTLEAITSLNVMFLVHDKILYKRLEAFPFDKLRLDELQLPILNSIFNQAQSLRPGQEFLNSAIEYYFHLLLESFQSSPDAISSSTLVENCIEYMEENYMHPIKLEDVANHIGRTNNHTSFLVRSVTGLTVVEHLNLIRIKNACSRLSYSTVPLEEVASSCGFRDVKYFCRVFKGIIGTTPTRYRTSHVVGDMCYSGDLAELDVPYSDSAYTYIPGARKCISWKTPLEYIKQETALH